MQNQENSKNQSKNLVLATLFLVVIGVGVGTVYQFNASAEALNPENKRFAVDVTGQVRSGPADARVKVVVFEDFTCPFCKQLNPILEDIKNDYRDKSVAFYVVNTLLADEHRILAQAVECSWKHDPRHTSSFIKALFESQPDDNPHQGWYEKSSQLKQIHDQVNPSTSSRIRQCIDRGETQQQVDVDLKISASNEVQATPTVAVQGQGVGLNEAKIRAAIDRALQ